MADNTTTTNAPAPADPNQPQPPRQNVPPGAPPTAPAPKRRGRWLKRIFIGVVVILVLVIALVALAPTIISTSPVRNFATGKINQNLNGRVTIDSWSVSWNSGLWLQGVK